MQSRAEARDPQRIGDEPSPFRDAFARARLESLGMGAVPDAKREKRKKGDRKRAGKPAPGPPPTFEVRIEKRNGKRSVDSARWNLLGRDGWELVAVTRKQAFFRRVLR
jgi:hypothetical protein